MIYPGSRKRRWFCILDIDLYTQDNDYHHPIKCDSD